MAVVLDWGWAALLPHTLSGATLPQTQTATFQHQKKWLKMHHLGKILRIFLSFPLFSSLFLSSPLFSSPFPSLPIQTEYMSTGMTTARNPFFSTCFVMVLLFLFQKTSHHSEGPKYRKYYWLPCSLLYCHRQTGSSTLKALLFQLSTSKGYHGA